MKNSIRDFWKLNGFYVSFGLGIVALVAALAIYNVSNHKGKQNQEINLNEPFESNLIGMDDTKDIVPDGDLDVPMDMQKNEAVTVDTDQVVVDQIVANVEDTPVSCEESTEQATEEVQETMSDAVLPYTPLENLTFLGMEEVSMPVLGNTILPYSMDTTVLFKTLGSYRCNPGVLLQAPVGTEVVSIWHGQVTDIQNSKEYGNIVTINLGSGYEMIYGQLQDIRVAVGDEVYRDTILGTVAEPTAYYQEEGAHVFFEVKKDGEPIDPMEILQLE